MQISSTRQAAGTLKSERAPQDVRQSLQAAANKKAEEQKNAPWITLSDPGKLQALHLKMLQKMQQSSASLADARKSAARAHAAQLKQQLEVLKKVALALGPIAAKGLLQQIKQIAQQIRQIAAELAQPTQSATNSPYATAAVNNAAVGNSDLPVDGNVDFASGEETETGEEQAAVKERIEAGKAAAQSGKTETEEADAEKAAADSEEADKAGNTQDAAASANAALARAEQASTEAEKEIREQEREESEENRNIGNNANAAAKARNTAREQQADVAMVRDLVHDLKLLLSLVKASLQHPNKEEKKDLKEINSQLEQTEALMQELEASAQEHLQNADALSALDASGAQAVDVGAADTAAETAMPSISVFV
jgi:hypothetical protein